MEQQYLPSRWEIELEFVQSLANIQYLNHLAQRNYLKSEEFLNYLDYLNYWREPEYAKYLVYPNCLHILTLLQSEDFRQSIVNPEFMNTVMNDVVERWQQQEESIEKETSYEARKANEDKNSTEDNYTFEDKNTTEDKNTSDNVTQEASSASPVNTDLVQSTT